MHFHQFNLIVALAAAISIVVAQSYLAMSILIDAGAMIEGEAAA